MQTQPENILQLLSFNSFWQLGYKTLLPIVPVDAILSAKTSLRRRRKSPLGKVPGFKKLDGTWCSWDWARHVTTEDDLVKWQDSGAGIGFKTGLQPDGTWSLIAIDADCLTEDHARIVENAIKQQLGLSPKRVGRQPKAMYIFRLQGQYPYTCLHFGERIDKGDFAERVEILTDGKQFVGQGRHPSGTHYTWPRALIPFHELPIVTTEQLNALMASLREPLDAKDLETVQRAVDVDQASLRDASEHVRHAVEKLPNVSQHFGKRDDYIKVLAAIKAAVADENEAYDIAWEWCERWKTADGRTNDPETVEADWRRLHAPFSIGATWLYAQLRDITGNDEPWMHYWLEDLGPLPQPALDPWDVQAVLEQAKIQGDVFPTFDLEQLMSRPPPEWLLEKHLPTQGMGFIYGEPGTYKSFWALSLALSMAAEFPTFEGYALKPRPGKVFYMALEGSYDLPQRVQAWQLNNMLDKPPSRFQGLEAQINLMNVDDLSKLVRTIKAACETASIIFIDTTSRSMPGADENLQKEMSLYVRACDHLRATFNCPVIGIHHASKAGDTIRGSTVLTGAADFVFQTKADKDRRKLTLTCVKQKAGPDSWSDHYEMQSVGLSLVPRRLQQSEIQAIRRDQQAEVLEFMEAAWNDDKPLSRAPNAKDREASAALTNAFGQTRAYWKETLKAWEAEELIAYRPERTGHNSKRQPGYEVISRERVGASKGASSIFE